jgi:hypothetical protein
MYTHTYIYIYTYKTRLASKEIFSLSNKTHREVGWAKDLPAPRCLMQNAHKFEDLALDNSALVHDSLRHLSFNVITTGDIEACVVSRDTTNIGTAVTTQPYYVRSIQIVLRLEWTPLHK